MVRKSRQGELEAADLTLSTGLSLPRGMAPPTVRMGLLTGGYNKGNLPQAGLATHPQMILDFCQAR